MNDASFLRDSTDQQLHGTGSGEAMEQQKCPTCGEVMESHLAYSDADNDYYFPACFVCVKEGR